jgi:hypothetical protein
VIVHLLPIGRGRFDLYAEPQVDAEPPPAADAGRVRLAIHRAQARWHQLVEAARTGTATGTWARWRDRALCALADSIDEQRTLWSLRSVTAAIARFPSSIDAVTARAVLDGLLDVARRHHGRWLALDLTLFVASGILFFVPGPNVIAYYLGFRVFGHLQSWRGAKQARTVVSWVLEPSDPLADLATLADLPHASRAARVERIAEALELPHLPSFFERAAA